jgi:hypothetical protein
MVLYFAKTIQLFRWNMKIWSRSFNTYLLLVLVFLPAGCETVGTSKQEATTLRFHLESPRDPNGRTVDIAYYRASPMTLAVEKESFLDEGSVTKAEVVEDHGTFAIRVELHRHGKLVLDTTTTNSRNRGRRILLFSAFGDARWVGAVRIDQRMSDGSITFTPDTTRAEADRIVRGLNNIAKALKKNPDF